MPTAFAIAAHPDDIEFVMAGTLLLLQQAGWDIHYMNVANGCCGSTVIGRDELIEMRRAEAQEACRLAGFRFHDSLANDMEIMYDRPTFFRLAAIVREVAPTVVLTHAPIDYMEDHTNTCRLAVSAAFARGMPNFPCDPPIPAISGDVTVYHAQPHGNCTPLMEPVRPSHYVDVGSQMAQKTAMLACHRSQKLWLDQSQGLDSYLVTMQELMRGVGRLSGRFEYAEGWRKHLHLGFCAENADPLAEVLGERCYCP
ncbi:MAG: PIG-L family deacetylase [Planctomycetaceae bacterium]|nr:PIG-L family deacetylase [Planctomycetaceae bacterium]